MSDFGFLRLCASVVGFQLNYWWWRTLLELLVSVGKLAVVTLLLLLFGRPAMVNEQYSCGHLWV